MVWNGVSAVSINLMAGGKPYPVLVFAPSYRWLQMLPEGFKLGETPIPVEVTKAMWKEVGPLATALATDVAVEVLKQPDEVIPQIRDIMRRSGEALGELSAGVWADPNETGYTVPQL